MRANLWPVHVLSQNWEWSIYWLSDLMAVNHNWKCLLPTNVMYYLCRLWWAYQTYRLTKSRYPYHVWTLWTQLNPTLWSTLVWECLRKMSIWTLILTTWCAVTALTTVRYCYAGPQFFLRFINCMLYPTGRKTSLEFKFCYFGNGRFCLSKDFYTSYIWYDTNSKIKIW